MRKSISLLGRLLAAYRTLSKVARGDPSFKDLELHSVEQHNKKLKTCPGPVIEDLMDRINAPNVACPFLHQYAGKVYFILTAMLKSSFYTTSNTTSRAKFHILTLDVVKKHVSCVTAF